MMMKSLKSMMMGGAILFGLSMCFTSCEGALDDLFGEWDKPAANASSGESTPSGGETPADPMATPLTMEVTVAGTIVVNNPRSGMQYSTDGGVTKTTMTTTTTIPTTGELAVGTKVTFYGNGTSITGYGTTNISGGTAQVKVYGNIMSLLNETGFATLSDPITLTANNTFTILFAGNAKLTDASGLLLPATALAFGCYGQMFEGCSALTAAPELPGTTLAANCYNNMFHNCTKLTAAPELPATTLANDCYYQMFNGCSKLSSVTCLATDITATNCTQKWLEGAGTDASVASRTLHIKNGQSTTDGNWNLATSGNGTDKLWTAVDDK